MHQREIMQKVSEEVERRATAEFIGKRANDTRTYDYILMRQWKSMFALLMTNFSPSQKDEFFYGPRLGKFSPPFDT